ncbi:MAG: polysaccharide biosynthesis C-terminal domain-containing protein [Saprospiraceae bacterium]|nr:polysaccharide biosynthesis C-terminal domain-containing protein [Saprospiraceae bacterium]
MGVLRNRIEQMDISRAYQFFQITRQITTMLIAILLAKSTLGVAEIGLYEQLQFLGYTLSFFWLSALTQGFLAIYTKLNEEEQHRLQHLASGTFLIIGISLGILSCLSSVWLSHVFTGGVVRSTSWILFALFFFPFQISTLVEHIYLVRKDTIGLIRWSFFSSMILVASLLIPIWIWHTLEAGLWGLICFGGLRLIWMLTIVHPSFSFRHHLSVIKQWGRISWPLIGYGIAGGATVVVDGWIINDHYQDARVFAIFKYGARELPFSLALASAVGTAAISVLVTNWATGLSDMKRRVTRISHILFPITFFLVATSSWWFSRLFSEAFAESGMIFNIYLMVLVSRIILTGPILTAKGDTPVILWIGLLEMLVNVVLSLVFIQYWGIAGVAWGTVIAYTFEKIVHMGYLKYKWQVSISEYLPTRLITFYTTILVGIYIWTVVN